MRTSRRIAVGCLGIALCAGAWWVARRGADAPAPDEASRTDDVGRRPVALDGVDASSREGGELAGAARAMPAIVGRGALDLDVVVEGPDGPVAGADVRLAGWSAEDSSPKASDAIVGDPQGDSESLPMPFRYDPERRATTDARGRCRFADVRSEAGNVSAAAPGFARGSRTFDWDRRTVAEVRVELTPVVAIEGTVVEAGTGAPIVGARIGIDGEGRSSERFGAESGAESGADASAVEASSVGPDGRFVLFAPIDVSSLRLSASAAGHAEGVIDLRGWRGRFDPERPVIRLPLLGAIEGVVRGADGRPLASATVSVSEVESVSPASDASPLGSVDDGTGGKVAPPTGADGAFVLPRLARGGRYRLRASADGFPSIERELTLDPGTPTVRLDLRFAPAATISVRVLGPDERPPASSVTITVTSAGVRQRREAWNSEGRHVFDRVGAGAVGVRVTSKSGADEERTVSAQLGAVAEVTIRLPAVGAIRGEVVDGAGRALLEATVTCDGRSETTEAYDLLVASSGLATVRRSVNFQPGEDLDLGDVRFERGIELSGRVLDVAGAPISGASVSAIDARSTARTDGAGRFALPHVARGPVSLEIEVAGGPATRVTVEAAEGGAPCELRVAGSGLVRGAVRGADGSPRAGVWIRFVRADDARAPSVGALTSRLGRVFAVLPEGTWNATFTSARGRATVVATVTVSAGAVKDVDWRLPSD